MNKLPEKWCIDRENKPDVIDWFNNNNAPGRKDYDEELLGWMTHFPAYYNNCHTSEWVESGYTEITHEQFKQHFMKKLPEHWYIKVTEENQSIVSQWRLTNATSFLHKENIEVGMFVMSDHHDGSYYYGSYNENELNNNDFPSHQSINFKTFLEITGMKTSTYTVTREQFLQGHELACSQWQERLTKKFAVQLIKSDTIEVDDDFVQLLRGSASNDTQREFLDKLFVDPNLIQPKDLKIGEAMRVKDTSSSYNGAVVLRTYDEYVNLNNPLNTWGSIGAPLFKGVRVKLKIEAEEC